MAYACENACYHSGLVPDPTLSALSDLNLVIDDAWSDLQGFLADLTEAQAAIQDERGWTVIDHVSHIAAWEDSVAILFRGKPRHEALGVDETYFQQASFDEINERIKQRIGHLPPGKAIEQLRQGHQQLMSNVGALSDADLGMAVCDLFPSAPRTDDRRVIDFINENTANHFMEHLGWMRALVNRAA